LPTPGLAARVYLVGDNLTKMPAGDGSLTVTLYDAAQPLTENAKPNQVWTIDPASLRQVLKKDGVGWGYDLWLPWHGYRPEIVRVRLIVKYESAKGQVAYSSPTDYAVRAPAAIKVTKVASKN
jgi:hypothetical protein